MPFSPVQAAISVLVLGLVAVLPSCKCGGGSEAVAREAADEPGEAAPAEAEPPVPPARGLERCRWVLGERAFSVRAPRGAVVLEAGESEPPFGLEIGSAVAWADGFAVGLLRQGKSQAALVAVTDGRGHNRIIELGAVHGPVAAPRVALHGTALLVAVNDSDAQGSTLRLGRIAQPYEGQVAWGPVVQEGRDESALFDLSVAGDSAVLIWDQEERASAQSRLQRVVFDPSTLQVKNPARPLQEAGADAEGPALTARPGGHWLVWSTIHLDPKQRGAGEAEGLGLLEEPLAHLHVVALGSEGDFSGKPLDLGEHSPWVFDVASSEDGGLVLALRASEPESGDRTVTVMRVRPDGSVTTMQAEHANLGLGAPWLLGERPGRPEWLGVRAEEGPSLLGELGESPRVELEPELLLQRREPVVAGPMGWLLVEPHGADLDFRLAQCAAKPVTPPR